MSFDYSPGIIDVHCCTITRLIIVASSSMARAHSLLIKIAKRALHIAIRNVTPGKQAMLNLSSAFKSTQVAQAIENKKFELSRKANKRISSERHLSPSPWGGKVKISQGAPWPPFDSTTISFQENFTHFAVFSHQQVFKSIFLQIFSFRRPFRRGLNERKD